MEPVQYTREVWGYTGPEWGSMVAYRALLGQYGIEPLEWRMHPMNLERVRQEGSPGEWFSVGWDTDGKAGAWKVFGAPLILDSTLEENKVRVLLEVDSGSFMPPDVGR